MISFRKSISSSFFRYSERTIASTEINDTPKEGDTQLFGVGKFEGLAISGWLHAYLSKKDIEKSKLNGANSG